MTTENRYNNRASGTPSAEAGFSLLEGLFAAALLLVVAVSILPLFMRALESNTRGGRSSQLSTFTTAELEEVGQAPINRPDWDLVTPGQNVLQLASLKWDTGPLFQDKDNPALLGDGDWIAAAATPQGLTLWTRDLAIRKYSFADIHTTIDVDGVTLSTLGDPRLFDSPLTTDADGDLFNAHMTEFRVSLVEDREGLPLAAGQRMTVGHFRVY
ncbi:MAG: hypothetical protein AAF657_10420 [Acidobacteriota bacterium]